jgi:hypothetical protein
VGVNVLVEVGVWVGVGVRVTLVGVTVSVGVDVRVGVAVDVLVGVAVGVDVDVRVRVGVDVAVSVAVGVGVDVRVGVGVDVTVGVRVGVDVAVGVDVGETCMMIKAAGNGITSATKFRGVADACAGLGNTALSKRNSPTRSQPMAIPERARKRIRNGTGKSGDLLPGRFGGRRIKDPRGKGVYSSRIDLSC